MADISEQLCSQKLDRDIQHQHLESIEALLGK
ncbi:hypothetical protein A1S_3498 [Acinetobacter baumannii ATCC 17978]|nr:hypothetical protein A1S_3498 [Acinetobacter baumannii ATCC 17978]